MGLDGQRTGQQPVNVPFVPQDTSIVDEDRDPSESLYGRLNDGLAICYGRCIRDSLASGYVEVRVMSVSSCRCRMYAHLG